MNKIQYNDLELKCQQGRCSIVVSIPACHPDDPGLIPGSGVSFFYIFFVFVYFWTKVIV